MAVLKKKFPPYSRLRQWFNEYGRSGQPDRANIISFMDVEGEEMIKALKAELLHVAKGSFEEEVFDKIVGKSRKQMHGTYQKWAKTMLQVMASYKG